MTEAAIPLGTVKTTSTQDQSPAQLYLAGQEDFVIPMVFPDYLIHIDGYEAEIFGRKITIPAQKAPYLGHAGVLVVNGKTGLTKYYEYGRYGPNGKTRSGLIPDVTLKGGMITESSLKKTLRAVSNKHGQSGRVAGVVLRGQVFDQALAWLKAKEAENSDPKRQAYDLGDHNCMTFVADLVDHIELDSPFRPPVVIPSAYMKQFQLSNTDLEYDYASDTLEISD
ncbi:hypothetical protein P8H27_06555 [Pseudomonas sp. sp1636]|uniref:hypothetical protein n=1 Tax=Pseudomonas sp. sp1636 TaxID=3036707 RepID=UPI0025A62829|nr:hypothetical protein [Pseudomonas sp. sp1636]MDM8348557.1 hypothetical protein [Pseudomonas sp. sp1636]